MDLAKQLGATHIINTLATDVELEVSKITSGRGVHVSLDTTGNGPLARKAWKFTRNHGKILQVGLENPATTWDISMIEHVNSGKQIIGCVQGDAVPQTYAPKMVKWWREGKLPLEKIVTCYPAAEFRKAFEEMKSGNTIKPVLVWSQKSGSQQ